MDFVLCENSYRKYLICQNVSTKECWTLIIHKYNFAFVDWMPPFVILVNAKITLLPDEKAIEMLEEYATKSSIQGTRVKKFIEHYKKLPF